MKTMTTFLIASIVTAMAWITPAYAEAGGGDSGFASLIPLVLIMVIFYFLLIRPQQKKLKEHRRLVDELKKGDSILTGGGLYGRVINVKDDVLQIEIAEGVRVKVKRDTIAGLTDIEPEKPVKGKRNKKNKIAKTKNTTAIETTDNETTDAEIVEAEATDSATNNSQDKDKA